MTAQQVAGLAELAPGHQAAEVQLQIPERLLNLENSPFRC
jgi:hypothetical protein